MAMYYYARKLTMKSPCSCSCCKNSKSSKNQKSHQYYDQTQRPPPLPPLPPLTSYSSKFSQAEANSKTNHVSFPSTTSVGKCNGGIPGIRVPQHETFVRKLPPCCANLSRSVSTYENFDNKDETEFHCFDDSSDERRNDNDSNNEREFHHYNECDGLGGGGGDDDDDDYGINSCKIYSPIHSSRGLMIGGSTTSTLTRQRRVSDESSSIQQQELGLGSGGMNGRTSRGSCSNTWRNEDRNGGGDKLNSLGFKGSQLISGTWKAVIQLVLPAQSHFPEKEFLFAFLLCSRLHHPPHQTLSTIFQRFSSSTSNNSESQEGHQEEEEDEEQDSGLNDRECCSEGESRDVTFNEELFPMLIKFVRFWGEKLPHDFRDDRMMHFIRIISRVCTNRRISSNPEVREEVSQLLAMLRAKLSALESFDGTLLRLRTEAKIGEPFTAPSVVTICPNVEKMAEQLSLVELERFSYIGPEELVAQLVRKDQSRTRGLRRPGECSGSCGELDTTKYLDAFIAWFKRLSMFVASEICKMSEKKSRCRVIEYWIKVAKECFKIRNFNSLMAILTGLIGVPVSRLKKTWHKICCAELIELQTAMDPKSNFSAYRTMYKTAISETQSVPHRESHNYKIIVPYFALLLRDVYNLNSTYPSSLSNGHINLAKYKELATLTNEIISWQSVCCQFVKIQSVFNSVQALPIFSEDELMCASYKCEEPTSFEEKEHYLKLRRGK